MVFSTWTITDRSYFNFQDGDNLTPDEVLLFGLWNVLFLWQCIPGSTTATCLPSHGRRRLPWPRPSRGSWCCSPTPSFGQNPKEQHIFLRIPSLMKYFSLVYFERLFAKLWTTCSLFIVRPIGYRPIPGIFLLLLLLLLLLFLLLLGPESDFYSKSLIYYIQASGSPQPIHFLKAHDASYPNTDKNTNTKTETVTKTKTARE